MFSKHDITGRCYIFDGKLQSSIARTCAKLKRVFFSTQCFLLVNTLSPYTNREQLKSSRDIVDELQKQSSYNDSYELERDT